LLAPCFVVVCCLPRLLGDGRALSWRRLYLVARAVPKLARAGRPNSPSYFAVRGVLAQPRLVRLPASSYWARGNDGERCICLVLHAWPPALTYAPPWLPGPPGHGFIVAGRRGCVASCLPLVLAAAASAASFSLRGCFEMGQPSNGEIRAACLVCEQGTAALSILLAHLAGLGP
jgi:hypothetical protein